MKTALSLFSLMWMVLLPSYAQAAAPGLDLTIEGLVWAVLYLIIAAVIIGLLYYLDAALNGIMTLADAGVVKAILPIATPATPMLSYFGAKFLTRLEIKLDSVLDFGTVLWRVL